MRDSETNAEMQEAANIARVLELIHAARAYRLLDHFGPVANLERCAHILCLAEDRGITPDQSEVDRMIREIVRSPSNE